MTSCSRSRRPFDRAPMDCRASLVAAGALAVSLLLALSCSLARPRPGPGTLEVTIQPDGADRTFLIHVPQSAPPAGGFPVVLLFHGRYGTAEGLEQQTGFSAIADREGFAAVYPQGEGRRWSDGRRGEDWKDIDFVCAILDTLDSFCSIDRVRVFASGMSNGAFFCGYLAGNRPDLVCAIAPVAGGLADPWPGAFSPARPVSVLMINGTSDPLVPYDGGEVGYENGRRDEGSCMPAEEAAAAWASAAGCPGSPSWTALDDVDTGDGCTCARLSWSPGADGSRVELIRVTGGGHTWPGLDDTLGERLVGLTCRDFAAPELIWDFFESLEASPDSAARQDRGRAAAAGR